jgi:hypothetical protein
VRFHAHFVPKVRAELYDSYSAVLARKLQAEEDARSHEIYKRRQQQQEEIRQVREREEERKKRKNGDGASRRSRKMKDKCIIM